MEGTGHAFRAADRGGHPGGRNADDRVRRVATAACLVSVALTVPPAGADEGLRVARAERPGPARRLRLVARHGSTRLVVGILGCGWWSSAAGVLFSCWRLEVFDIGDAGAGC